MAVNDDVAVAEVEALLRRTLHHKAAGLATPPRALPGESRPTRRPSDPRRRWTAVAACAVVLAGAAGIVAFRTARDGAAPAASPAATPSTTTAPTTTTVAAAVDGALGPDPDGPHTAYGTIRVMGETASGVDESLTLVGDDIDTSFGGSPGAGGQPQPNVHNRRVDDVLYIYFRQPDGSYAWIYDPDDETTLSLHPTGHTPFEVYEQVADSATFEHVADERIDGIPVRRVSATTPEAVNAELLRLGGSTGIVESLDMWVTDDNVVLRIEATLAGDPPTQVVVEFSDVGDPGVEVAAPPDATEVDAEG
jgi:hypothetical protein